MAYGALSLRAGDPIIIFTNNNGAQSSLRLPSTYNSSNNLSLVFPKRNGSFFTDTIALKSEFASGRYSPSWTSTGGTIPNVTSSCHYTKVNNQVTVYGSLEVETASGSNTFDLTLPFASDLTSPTDLIGFAQRASNSAAILHCFVVPETTTNVGRISFTETSPTTVPFTDTLFFHFTYQIK